MKPEIITLNAPKPAGSMPVFKEELYRGAHQDFNLVRVDAGITKPAHPYEAGDSFMLILAGSMNLLVDGETYALSAGQMAVIPKGATRGFTAGPEGLTFFAAHLQG